MELTLSIAAAALALAAYYAVSRTSSALVREYEAGVLVRRGKVARELPTGKSYYWTPTSEVHLYDLRAQRLTVAGQEVLTSDGVPVKVSLLVTFRVTDPKLALTSSDGHTEALYADAQLALRGAITVFEFERITTERGVLEAWIQKPLTADAAKLGLAIDRVSIKDVMVGGDLKRALADVACARAEARSKVERVRGETAALRGLTNAAQLLERHTGLYQLRLLEAAQAAAASESNTLVLGLSETPTAKTNR